MTNHIPENTIMPTRATYAKWLDDKEFIEFWGTKGKPPTLCDVSRSWELWDLVRQTRHLDGDIIEAGVFKGGTAAILCKSAQLHSPDSTVYLCDTFRGLADVSDKDTPRFFMGQMSSSRGEVNERLSILGFTNYEILEGTFPGDVAESISDKTFKLFHSDVDTYLSTRNCLNWVWPRLERGGIIVIDDYGERHMHGVVEAVDAFAQQHEDKVLFIYNLNAHVILIRMEI